ncbi:MAG: hypothetical protein AAFR25_04050 [Cyanobacteria bacterium J06629_19]
MPRQKATPLRLALATAATLALLPLTPPLNSPLGPSQIAKAHTVEIEGDVGATLHIEPNDTPRAGEESLSWFALTRKGGETIPLSACDCQLSIYSQPKSDTALLTPSLNPVDAEGYQDIPGARFAFPNVGAYTLTLSGTPKQPEDFTPFELNFDVTVAAGQSAPAQPSEDSSELPTETTTPAESDISVIADGEITEPVVEQRFPKSLLFGLLGLGTAVVLGSAIFFSHNKQKT